MDENYTLVLVLSISALVGAVAIGIKQMYHCKSLCCESDCSKNNENNEKTPFLNINTPEINDIITRSRSNSTKLSPASARKVSFQAVVIPSDE